MMATFTISTIALLIALSRQPVDTDSEKLDLAATNLDIRSSLIENLQLLRSVGRDAGEDDFADFFFEQAETHGTRLLVVEHNNRVLLDTEAEYPRLFSESFQRNTLLTDTRTPVLESSLFTGTFSENGQEWLYVGQPILRERVARVDLLVAMPMPEATFRSTLEEYRDAGLFLALLQSSLIGMVVAVVLSYITVRWISRPLGDIVGAAGRVAEGDFSVRIPERGPNETRIVAHAFNDMTARVALGLQTQRDFLANVSHDLRTPLTSIQGFAQAIAEGVADAEGAQHAGNIIYNEAGRLHRMVEELLDLAKIQAGRMDMLRQAVELDQILKSISQSLQIKASEKNIDFQVAIQRLPRIAGDGDRLAQVFTNLVDNAIKHTPPDGQVWLRALLHDESGGIIVVVQDTGEGIPQEDLPRIFERFYQVDKSRARVIGTGLGLAIAQEIVEAHHGRIWAESEVGQGTRFYVWLPQPYSDARETVLVSRKN